MTKFTAMLALPNGEMARSAEARLQNITDPSAVSVVDDVSAGVWLIWSVEADTDQEGIYALQEIRLRAEMDINAETLFQTTPLIIVRGDAVVIHSEEVYCI